MANTAWRRFGKPLPARRCGWHARNLPVYETRALRYASGRRAAVEPKYLAWAVFSGRLAYTQD
jgi:hypothetical protein